MDKYKIEEIKNTILSYLNERNIKLNRLVLFGSYATGENTPDSDVDLIIISKDYRDKEYSERINASLGINRALVKNTNLPFDLLYYSDHEWENSETLIIREARQHGVTIYS